MPKTYTKTTRVKEPKQKKEKPKKVKAKVVEKQAKSSKEKLPGKKKKTKWDILASDCDRLSILEIYKDYKSRMKTASLKELADRVYSDYICIISADLKGVVQCSTCTSRLMWDNPLMQNGHYRTRAHMITRFDDTNCHAQCRSCNCAHNGNYRQYYLFMVDKYGSDYEQRLRTNEEIKQIKNYEYAEMIQGRYDIIKMKRFKLAITR